jgi:hypothetical protein
MKIDPGVNKPWGSKYHITAVRRVAALTQKINCLHIISAKNNIFACTKKYYY